MYYWNKFSAKADIDCYVVFKKRKFDIFNKIFGNKTIRRGYHYRPSEGKIIEGKESVNISEMRISYGIFSYVSWCPVYDPECVVWLCKIPKGSIVYQNNWEYVSNCLEFIRELDHVEEEDNDI